MIIYGIEFTPKDSFDDSLFSFMYKYVFKDKELVELKKNLLEKDDMNNEYNLCIKELYLVD